MTLNLSAVSEAHIAQAARMQSADAAVNFLQDLIGITDGGVAALQFSDGFEWASSSAAERADKLISWIEMERIYARIFADTETVQRDEAGNSKA